MVVVMAGTVFAKSDLRILPPQFGHEGIPISSSHEIRAILQSVAAKSSALPVNRPMITSQWWLRSARSRFPPRHLHYFTTTEIRLLIALDRREYARFSYRSNLVCLTARAAISARPAPGSTTAAESCVLQFRLRMRSSSAAATWRTQAEGASG